jgi:hypothetical protein
VASLDGLELLDQCGHCITFEAWPIRTSRTAKATIAFRSDETGEATGKTVTRSARDGLVMVPVGGRGSVGVLGVGVLILK